MAFYCCCLSIGQRLILYTVFFAKTIRLRVVIIALYIALFQFYFFSFNFFSHLNWNPTIIKSDDVRTYSVRGSHILKVHESKPVTLQKHLSNISCVTILRSVLMSLMRLHLFLTAGKVRVCTCSDPCDLAPLSWLHLI